MKTKTKNEIIIDGVHHVLVPDSDEGCSSCSLREECYNSGIDAYICSLIMKEPASHFEIKKRKVYTKKNTHDTKEEI